MKTLKIPKDTQINIRIKNEYARKINAANKSSLQIVY